MKIEITNQTKWHQSITLKLIMLAFLGLVLLIPLEMIKQVIRERQANSEKVIKEVADQWAAKQCISGPVLNIPVRVKPDDGTEKSTIVIWHILPEKLAVSGTVRPQVRKRGIYRAVVYDSDINITGRMVIPPPESNEKREILWHEAYYTTGISDNRGLKGSVVLKVDSALLDAEPGVRDNDLYASGISFPCPVSAKTSRMDFALDLSLSGSLGLLFTPSGKTTSVSLESEWKSPSFTGNFLPLRRTVGEKGFTAVWEVTHLNRNFPQSWAGKTYQLSDSSFGVDLYQPVDHYQKSWRSARYGILFIALTFLVLLFAEITRKESIHIFHYLLVSLALVLFFSLLNAISEQAGFAVAYLIAATATITLISAFTLRLMKTKSSAFALTGILTLLYAFIFILLNLDDFAYLAGNIGLFILLAAVMLFSGKMSLFSTGSSELSEGS